MKQKFDLQKKVAHKIDGILEKKRLKRKDLAHAMGLTPSLVSKLFNGQSRMNLLQLDTICSYLNINISDLLFDTEKPDPTTYVYEEKEADVWCMSEIGIFMMILLVKGSATLKTIEHFFKENVPHAKKCLDSLIEKNLVIIRPDGSLAVNPPNFISYNLINSKKFPVCLTNMIKILITKYFQSSEDWKKQTISISKTHMNWFTDAQLNYIKEQIFNMSETLKGFLVENRRKDYRDAKQIQFISIESIQVLRE